MMLLYLFSAVVLKHIKEIGGAFVAANFIVNCFFSFFFRDTAVSCSRRQKKMLTGQLQPRRAWKKHKFGCYFVALLRGHLKSFEKKCICYYLFFLVVPD